MQVKAVAGAVFLVALVAGCRDSQTASVPPKPAASVEMQVTEVICRMEYQNVSILGGATACASALEQFLAEHPRDAILSVVPIEAVTPTPPDARHRVHPGTYRLVVMHHQGMSPGVRADQLKFSVVVCNAQPGPRAPVLRPDDCVGVLRRSAEYYDASSPPVFWIPISGKSDPELGWEEGTQEFIVLQSTQVTRLP